MRNIIKQAMGQWNACLTMPEGSESHHIKRGVYQGDSLSPLVFVLVTAGIIKKIKEDPTVNRYSKGVHKITAFMDDLKRPEQLNLGCHDQDCGDLRQTAETQPARQKKSKVRGAYK